MDGILNINKPWGKTSFSIVAAVKRLTGERRVGHTGTLDPAATGVLPVCLGRGTRVAEFLVDATKVYRTQIILGVTTDTHDADGNITHQGDPTGISRKQLESALTSFCGLISQTPPMYSAVKHQGKRLYELARAGIKVERRSRSVTIHHLKLVDFKTPVVTVEIVCGKGTYIRSLAHELGQTLGCGASLKSLTRLKCGRFDIKDAVSVPQLEHAFRYGYWQHFVYPMDVVLSHWTAMVVNDDTSQAIKNGRPLVFKTENGCAYHEQPSSAYLPVENHCRVYTPDGHFLGILHFNPKRGQWQAKKVLL